MKRIIVAIVSIVFCFGLAACGSDDSDDSSNAEKEKVYGIGDTWTVNGQWNLTINSVTPTDERNEFADTNPAEVVIIDYTYENLGYEDSNEIMNGLYLDLEMGQIVDSAGQMCQSYPASSVTKYAQETPVGVTCNAQAAIGLTQAGGPIEITMNEYDGDNNEQTATFKLEF